jgi:hypothetical protein
LGDDLAKRSEPVVFAAPAIKFIRDVPADDDFFDTHTRVAEAIINAIGGNSEIKVVGLLGRWGSGKSTVAKKIVSLLEGRKDSGFRIFIYDAWLHQSDPLRRSFLESLIGNLVRAGAIAKGKWTKELEKLSAPVEDTRTIETPSLSSDARWIGLSILAVPIGLGFLKLDTLKEAFGRGATVLGRWTVILSVVLVLLPILTWVCIYLIRRPWKSVFNSADGFKHKAFWRMLDEQGEPTSALQIFTDGQAKHKTTRTFRSTEPTSLEFGRMFQEIMREAAENNHRLIILIDNLDRVAEPEALQMWATIRSFFLASHETEDVKHEPFHPTVILPLDRHAIEELFAGSDGHGGRDRARSFMDKTFDVTFEVTEPVNSDWRAFLGQQMASMFGPSYQAQWGFSTRRLFEAELTRQQGNAGSPDFKTSTFVTPREINKLLNRIGALYLQWAGAGIPVEVMALYVIRRDEIDRGLLAFLQSDDVGIAAVAPEWRLQVAALHYGVEVHKAAQVTLGEPVRSAIIRRDTSSLQTMSTFPGFGEIFEFATANLPEPDDSKTPLDILANAVLLLKSLKVGGEEWVVAAWRNLTSTYHAVAASVTPTTGAIEIVKVLSENVEPDDRQLFLETSANVLTRLLSQPSKTAKDDLALRGGAEGLVRFASSHDLPAPLMHLKSDPRTFVTRVSELSVAPSLWPLLRSDHDGTDLGNALSEMLGSADGQQYVPKAVRCFTLPKGDNLYEGEIDFENIADKANKLARDPHAFGGDPLPGIRVLAELSYGRSEGRKYLAALLDEGVLATRLGEASVKADWIGFAEIVTIFLWGGKKFDAPAAFRWADLQQQNPNGLQQILSMLGLYFPGQMVPILWAAHKVNNFQTSSFIELIIGYAVTNDALGNFDANAVLTDLLTYKYAVPYRLRDKFLEQVNRRSDFFEALEDAPLGPQIAEAADYLKRKGGDVADRADAIMRHRVELADAAAWTEALRSGGEPYGMGTAFIKSGGLQFNRRSGLFEALNSSIPTLVDKDGREMRERWFTLVELLKTKPKRALMQALGFAVGDAPPAEALHILKTGGVQFLKAGGFAGQCNRSVQKIILPHLQKKEGRDWLKDNMIELSGWVQRADDDDRSELYASLKVLRDSKLEERRYSADVLGSQWGLSSQA